MKNISFTIPSAPILVFLFVAYLATLLYLSVYQGQKVECFPVGKSNCIRALPPYRSLSCVAPNSDPDWQVCSTKSWIH